MPKTQPKLKPKSQQQEQRTSNQQSVSPEQPVQGESHATESAATAVAAANRSITKQHKLMPSRPKAETRPSPAEDTVTFFKRDSRK